MNYLTEFDGKPFQSVSKVDESLEKLADEVDESAKEAEKALTPFIDRVKALLGERLKDVRLTHRLTDTPAIVSARTRRNEHSDGETVRSRRARKCQK